MVEAIQWPLYALLFDVDYAFVLRLRCSGCHHFRFDPLHRAAPGAHFPCHLNHRMGTAPKRTGLPHTLRDALRTGVSAMTMWIALTEAERIMLIDAIEAFVSIALYQPDPDAPAAEHLLDRLRTDPSQHDCRDGNCNGISCPDEPMT